MDYYDREWNFLLIRLDQYSDHEKRIQKADNLVELVPIAKKLAEGFPQVRVDLYRTNDGKVYFGEMTFAHWSGFVPFEPMEWDYKFGEWFALPDKEK